MKALTKKKVNYICQQLPRRKKCFTSLPTPMTLQCPDFTCKGTHTFKMAHIISLQFLKKLHMDKFSAGMTVEANNLK